MKYGDKVRYVRNGKRHWLDNRVGTIQKENGDGLYEVLFGREHFLYLAHKKNLRPIVTTPTSKP